MQVNIDDQGIRQLYQFLELNESQIIFQCFPSHQMECDFDAQLVVSLLLRA